MFEYLKGKIEYKKPDYLALDVNGVGYKINISLRTYDFINIGEEVKLYIHNYIKEDAFKLIGFLEERERNLFEMLLSVKGIGVSLALSVMSTFDIDTIRNLVAADDYNSLKRVPKLGEKKSQQLILDLKSKMKTLDSLSIDARNNEASKQLMIEDELISALEGLGYSKKEISALITREELKNFKTIEEAIKGMLKKVNY